MKWLMFTAVSEFTLVNFCVSFINEQDKRNTLFPIQRRRKVLQEIGYVDQEPCYAVFLLGF